MVLRHQRRETKEDIAEEEIKEQSQAQKLWIGTIQFAKKARFVEQSQAHRQEIEGIEEQSRSNVKLL